MYHCLLRCHTAWHSDSKSGDVGSFALHQDTRIRHCPTEVRRPPLYRRPCIIEEFSKADSIDGFKCGERYLSSHVLEVAKT